MKRLVALVVYLCVGTILAQTIGVTYAWSKGYLDKQKLLEMAAVAHGVQRAEDPKQPTEKKEETSEQPSFEEIEQARLLRSRNLELREQALSSGLDRVRHEQRKLLDEKESYDRVRVAFNTHLHNMREGAVAQGRADVRAIWESIKPKQAKEQILQMLAAGEEEDVVAIFSEMPIAKQAKICAEFSKTEQEVKTLDDILRLIRQGVPESKAIDQTKDDLQPFNPETTK